MGKEEILKVSDEHSVTILPNCELIDAKTAAIRYNKKRYGLFLVCEPIRLFKRAIAFAFVKKKPIRSIGEK